MLIVKTIKPVDRNISIVIDENDRGLDIFGLLDDEQVGDDSADRESSDSDFEL